MKPWHQLAAGIALASFAVSIPSATENDAPAIEAGVKKTILERYPDQKIVHVVPSAFPGLYEVFTGTEIFYADAKVDYIISGRLIDARTKANLTSNRLDELNSIDFKSLPFERAIKVVKGDGSRQLAVFSDPDCPFCKELEKELAKVTDITVYTFLFPLEEIHPKAPEKTRNIWCADDRAVAWTQWMVEGKEPSSASCSTDPTAELVKLGQGLNIHATPTLYLSTGKRMVGGMTAKELTEVLDKTSAESRPPGSRS
jgi:thiol:disulfide interchange protein DsbC